MDYSKALETLHETRKLAATNETPAAINALADILEDLIEDLQYEELKRRNY